MERKKGPGQVTEAAYYQGNCTLKARRKSAGKLSYMLKQFSTGQRLHRFAAERIGDHALPSTISSLQQAHGISFSREWVEVLNNLGGETRAMMYLLEGNDLTRVRNLALEGD